MQPGGESGAQDTRQHRDCAELRLYSPDCRQLSLIILLTHLKSRLDPEKIDPGGIERRAAELRTAVHIYNELRAEWPDTPIIFAGDQIDDRNFHIQIRRWA